MPVVPLYRDHVGEFGDFWGGFTIFEGVRVKNFQKYFTDFCHTPGFFSVFSVCRQNFLELFKKIPNGVF